MARKSGSDAFGDKVGNKVDKGLKDVRESAADKALPSDTQTSDEKPIASGDRCRVVIVDDHPLTAQGIAGMLLDDGAFEVVGVASSGINGIAEIKAKTPHCAILDLHLPDANGFEVFIEARRWSPKTRFIILTGLEAPTAFRDLIDNGVEGLLLKSGDPAMIVQNIKSVCAGETVVAPEVLEKAKAVSDKSSLTPRELEVLHAVARGWSNAEIADHLNISPKTVDSHRTSLMKKLGVHSTATLLVKAMREGIIDVASDGDMTSDSGIPNPKK